ncbi:hypothetical protein V8G54_012467 [Vigna mungo]|uniref:Uncharacterized protein n=1 Tax=Vigna mungo TaxID=3915 RepID=A0AAQ3NTT9_VIGMU
MAQDHNDTRRSGSGKNNQRATSLTPFLSLINCLGSNNLCSEVFGKIHLPESQCYSGEAIDATSSNTGNSSFSVETLIHCPPLPTSKEGKIESFAPSYRLALDEKALVDGLSKRELLDVAFEFNARDTLLNLQASNMLEEDFEQKKELATVLCSSLGCNQDQTALQLKDACTIVKNAIDCDHKFQRKNDNLSLDYQKLKTAVEELTAQNAELTQQKGVLITQLEEVHNEVFN